jgi:DNA-binding CsgD family transcriptional regulator
MDGEQTDRRLLGALPELYALRTVERFPAHALAIVNRVIGGDKADWTEVDLASKHFRVLVEPTPPELADLDEARRAYMPQHPVLTHFLRDPRPGARLISDFLTAREFHRTELYGEFFATVGVEDQLTTTVLLPGHTSLVGISIDRDRRSFDERERKLLDLLQPHLMAAWGNSIAYSEAASQSRDEHACGHKLERLTDRQREILEALAAGATNAQIGHTLQISTGTVRKHLEHIFRRLEVTTRTAAAARYLAATPRIESRAWTASEPGMLAA